jgi:NTP pyrophosphohydrolases including oxidative damage repair enzymes
MKMDLCKLSGYKPELILDSCCRRAAVCIPLIRNENRYDVLFELRSGEIEDQPGDVCFPGGMIESGEVPSDAAIRECCEELLIERDSIDLLGASDFFHSYNVTVYPFAVELKDYAFSYSPDEVSSVFTVPLSLFSG